MWLEIVKVKGIPRVELMNSVTHFMEEKNLYLYIFAGALLIPRVYQLSNRIYLNLVGTIEVHLAHYPQPYYLKLADRHP